jgi:hypothetical protein
VIGRLDIEDGRLRTLDPNADSMSLEELELQQRFVDEICALAHAAPEFTTEQLAVMSALLVFRQTGNAEVCLLFFFKILVIIDLKVTEQQQKFLHAMYMLIEQEIDFDDFGRRLNGMEIQWPKFASFFVNLQSLAADWMPHFMALSVEQMEKLLK